MNMPGQETRLRANSVRVPRPVDEQTRTALIAFGATLRRERIKRGWTQDDAAAELGVDPSYYARIERGRVNVTLGVFLTLCRLYGFPIPRVLR